MKKGQTRRHKIYGLKHQDKRTQQKGKAIDVTSKEFIIRDECSPKLTPKQQLAAEKRAAREFAEGQRGLAETSPFGVMLEGPNSDTFPR